jgi:pyrroloquinoline quinone biosynthesis protein B
VSSILLRDGGELVFDATPDLRFQLSSVPDGLFLTHAHLGHLPGLLYFGPEAVDADHMPVYCTEALATVIGDNAPFKLLVERGNVDITPIDPQSPVLFDTATVTAHRVSHRDELSTGAVAYRIETTETSLLYMTDIDEWSSFELGLVRDVDVALVDGTFWSHDEIDRIDNVPHPPVTESIERLRQVSTDVYFTHLNHTNPLVTSGSAEVRRVAESEFEVLEEGQTIELSNNTRREPVYHNRFESFGYEYRRSTSMSFASLSSRSGRSSLKNSPWRRRLDPETLSDPIATLSSSLIGAPTAWSR